MGACLVDVEASNKLESIGGKLDSLIGLIHTQSIQIARLEERLSGQNERQDRLENRVGTLEHRADDTERKIWRWSGGIAVIILIITLSVQYWPRPGGKSHDAPAYATEKRQNQYPPQRLPPQEGK